MTALQFLKHRARKDSLVLIINNPHAKRLIVAWTYAPIPVFKDFTIPDTLQIKDAINVCWRNVPVNYEILAVLADIPKRLVYDTFDMLRQCGLVYPDGSAYDLALRVIGNEVAALIAQSLPEAKA